MSDLLRFPLRVDDKIKEAELLVIEVAARIQLSPTQVQQAEQNYTALSDYIDGEGSPLEDCVQTVHASGSFAIGAPIVGKLKETQHDVDAVLELIGFKNDTPKYVLKLTEEALLRPDKDGKTRYQGMVTRNSRCVTVTYKDGRTVDLMPVHHVTDHSDIRKNLFHYKEARGTKPEESYKKPVAPRGFKDWYLKEEETLTGQPLVLQERYQTTTASVFAKRQVLLAKADTEDFPEQKSLPEKTARTLAIQLLKRNRDIKYMGLSGRKPPSVLIATLGMHSSRNMHSLLVDELINVANYLISQFERNVRLGLELHVTNPSWNQDIISDRWKSVSDQRVYLQQLKELVADMIVLKSENQLGERKRILQRNFGETVSNSALGALEKQRSQNRITGATKVTRTGAIALAGASSSRAKAKKTPYGGEGG